MIFLASIPAPPSDRLSLGPLDLRLYGLCIALGVIAAIWAAGRSLEFHRVGTVDDMSSIGIWAVGAGIVGARLYHVATEWSRFSNDLDEIPKIWEGGLGIPGGLLFGVVAGILRARIKGISAPAVLTAGAIGIPLAQSIGRWGNYFNQELFGRPTDLPWALEVDADKIPAGYEAGTTFHPTFLYESLWTFGLFVVLYLIDRRTRLAPGRLFPLYLIGYGIGRFWIEALRIDPTELSDVIGLRWNQWVALGAVVGGAVWFFETRDTTRTWATARLDGRTLDDLDEETDRGYDADASDADVIDAEATDDETTDGASTDDDVADRDAGDADGMSAEVSGDEELDQDADVTATEVSGATARVDDASESSDAAVAPGDDEPHGDDTDAGTDADGDRRPGDAG